MTSGISVNGGGGHLGQNQLLRPGGTRHSFVIRIFSFQSPLLKKALALH